MCADVDVFVFLIVRVVVCLIQKIFPYGIDGYLKEHSNEEEKEACNLHEGSCHWLVLHISFSCSFLKGNYITAI
jgi:hypothetical protein